MLFKNPLRTPVRLLGMGIVFLAVGLFVGYQSWDLDHGISPQNALRTAGGAIESVQHRHGLELRLVGHPEVFRLPRSTKASPEAEAAIEQAVENRSERVELRYSPKPARAFTGEVHRLFYELRIDGQVVHSYADSRRAWRDTRQIGRAIAQIAAVLGLAFVVLAFRNARSANSWTVIDPAR